MDDLASRAVADIRDRVAWAKVRSRGTGASDAAGYSKVESAPLYAKSKLYSPFEGNGYTRHGHEREPLMLAAFHVEQNFLMYRSIENDRHLATPDGLKISPSGEVLPVQAKTTNKPFRTIPLRYRRQVWWEQYVLGATRTLFIWEVHDGFRPVSMEPESDFIDRDDDEIQKMITIADEVHRILDRGDAFKAEMEARKWAQQ